MTCAMRSANSAETGQTVPDGVGPLCRCVFESLAMAYQRKIDLLTKITGREIDRIHVIGGGSRNDYLCQMTADACGLPVIAGPVEAASAGNIIMQAISSGIVGNLDEGRRLIEASSDLHVYQPSNHDLWEKVLQKWESPIAGLK